MHKKKKKRRKTPTNKQIEISYYAILYMDVLNQREKLSRITEIPTKDDDRDNFVTLLKDTYGVIDGFAQLFESYFNYASSRRPSPSLPKLHRQHYLRITDSRIGKTLFSDSMLYYVSLNEEHGALPIIRILDLMYAASATFIGTLALGHPSRGGLDVGIAADFPRVGIYGPGLYKVYQLESEVAQYPRIVIGTELQDYLRVSSQDYENNPDSTFRRSFAETCLSLVHTDSDGISILDCAGKAIREKAPQLREAVVQALDYVQSEWERFKKENNNKLESRYFSLMTYLADRQKEYWS